MFLLSLIFLKLASFYIQIVTFEKILLVTETWLDKNNSHSGGHWCGPKREAHRKTPENLEIHTGKLNRTKAYGNLVTPNC